jgi:predicted Rossmann fold flavoprotein
MSDTLYYPTIAIGGGAAGFFAAIAVAEGMPNSTVLILEAGKEPLAKVRISGGGRCNVTHACFDPQRLVAAYPRGGKALRGAFTRFQPQDTIDWFRRRGVELKTEADGRMFPTTDDSATIVDCLMAAARSAGVKIWTQARVRSITKPDDRFSVELADGRILVADRILLATGSSPQGYRWVRDLGHHVIPPIPSLFAFQIKDPELLALAGVSAKNVAVKLAEAGKEVPSQSGDILITHWGLSGPAILKLSAWGSRFLSKQNYRSKLIINWLPTSSPDKLSKIFQDLRLQIPQKSIRNNCPVIIPQRLWIYMLERSQIDLERRWSELSNKGIDRLIAELLRGEYSISGKGQFKEEFVTCGGVDLKEVDFKTMSSKICPNLFFAGEILDIDAITGGYNFQSAWTTAFLASQGIIN